MFVGAPFVAVLLAAATVDGEGLRLDVVCRLGDLDDAVTEQVRARIGEVAEEKGYALDEGAGPRLYVVIEWAREGVDFRVKVAKARPDEELQRAEEFDCAECTAPELLDRIGDAAAATLDAGFEPPPPAPVVAPPPMPEPEPEPAALHDDAGNAKLGRTGWAGVGLASLGVATLATGVAFAVVGERRIASSPTFLRNYRPTGFALIGVGAALGATGAVLIVRDRKRGPAKLSLSPTLRGVQISGSF